jgi:hypothetical protein
MHKRYVVHVMHRDPRPTVTVLLLTRAQGTSLESVLRPARRLLNGYQQRILDRHRWLRTAHCCRSAQRTRRADQLHHPRNEIKERVEGVQLARVASQGCTQGESVQQQDTHRWLD